MRSVIAGLFLAMVLSTPLFAQVDVIPKPQSVTMLGPEFTLDSSTVIVAKGKEEKRSAAIFAKRLAEAGLSLKLVSKAPKRNYVEFMRHGEGVDQVWVPEGFHVIRIEQDRIKIAGFEVGQFHAIQTLLQLLPPRLQSGSNKVPGGTIIDRPRFRYRGMHLDISRHFQPVEFVKRYIDLMSQYKFNYFHWHLTDDQGWRIEIKKYPRLTEIGSMRPETMKDRNFAPYIGDGIPHGGFYTQEQIKDVVAYAKARHITVIPEIELPGHASAALAAYPQFGCKSDHQYKVQTTWGIFKEVFCPTDETFKFLEDVLDETIKLFPDSPYIHIGGDEVLKDHWKESAFVQDLKKKENLKDELEVQSYFVRRIEKFLSSRGKKMIGWDEILEGGLAPNATVMSWRGMKGGIEAAKSKHDVIMTPTDFVYFDYGQGDPSYEPLNIGSYVPLEKVYSFEPVPKELTAEEAKYIIGGQANMWTEYMKTPQHIEYMAFPRMLALSEVLWSRAEDRNYADFRRRLNGHLPRLDALGVNYRIPEPGGLKNVITQDEKVQIHLQPATGTRVHYTIDGTTPDERSLVYEKPIEFSLGEREVKTLKTVVINGAGRKSVVYASTIARDVMREPAVLGGEQKTGLKYQVFIPKGDGSGDGEVKRGETRSTALNQFTNQGVDLKKPFAVMFDGYFKAPVDGLYEFQVDSTWDTTVVLAAGMLIDDAGTKDRKIRSAVVPLKAGLHRISLRYNHRGGDASFRFRWGIKGEGLTQAWGGEFVY
jgi:hexosaminidase